MGLLALLLVEQAKNERLPVGGEWTGLSSGHSPQITGNACTVKADTGRPHSSHQASVRRTPGKHPTSATSTFSRQNREFYQYLLRHTVIKLPLSVELVS